MATVYDIANFLVSTSSVVGMKDMTNLKLNKLVYFVQGIYCAKTGKPLFPDSIEAWTYGPVIRALYDKYKCYGDSIITGVDSPYNENCFYLSGWKLFCRKRVINGKITINLSF